MQSLEEHKVIPKTLGVHLEHAAVHPLLIQGFDSMLDSIIQSHNEKNGLFSLERIMDTPCDSCLMITTSKSRLIGKGTQIGATAVSFAGLLLVPGLILSTGAPVVVFFWYFPRSRTQLNFSFSEDIRLQGQRSNYEEFVNVSGFWRSIDSQIQKQIEEFYDIVDYEIWLYEENLK